MPKNKKTAFYFFAREYADRARCSLQEAITNSYTEWKELTATEKSPYEKKLIEWKELQKTEKERSTPELYHPIKVEDTYFGTDAVLSKERMKLIEELKAKIQTIPDIKNQKWYFIKFQTYCKTDEEIEEKCRYVLAEVGVIEYSLAEGITNQYNEFIKPEIIPPGYTALCKEKSKQYHQIPLDYSQANSNYGSIYSNILKIVFPNEENGYYTPLFCLNEDFQEVKYGLSWLHSKYEHKNGIRLDRALIDLQTLVISLAAHRRSEISCNVATEILTSYQFDYAPESRCEFHEELGISFCALGYVKRYAYLISDQLCPIYKIEVKEGKHLPTEKPVFNKSNAFNNDDFRKPAKLLRDSYKHISSSRASHVYDPIGSTTDFRYAPENEFDQQRRKVNDAFKNFEDSRSIITSISNIHEKSSISNRNIIESDDDTAQSNDDEWVVVANKSAVSRGSLSSVSKAPGRGRPPLQI